MKRKLTALLLALPMLVSLASCDKEETASNESTAVSDWRNTIEYEGSFFVDSTTKLLYAYDRGSIILWDNSGDGSILQELEYSSAEDSAIESIEITDVNLDGYNDIKNIYSQTEAGNKYNLWLWNEESGKYTSCKLFRTINDPVISEDGKTVYGSEDKGAFGKIETVYAFEEGGVLTETSAEVTGASEIAQSIASDIAGSSDASAVLEKAEGTAVINEIECAVYTLSDSGGSLAYIAYSPDAYWYIDNGCVGAYRSVIYDNETYSTGGYAGEAGDASNICAELYGCDAGELTIGMIDMGTVVDLSYNESGAVIMPDPEAGIVGTAVNGYHFYRNGSPLCHILRTEDGKYYCCDSELSGDMYYHLISASGDAVLAEGSVAEFYIE